MFCQFLSLPVLSTCFESSSFLVSLSLYYTSRTRTPRVFLSVCIALRHKLLVLPMRLVQALGANRYVYLPLLRGRPCSWTASYCLRAARTMGNSVLDPSPASDWLPTAMTGNLRIVTICPVVVRISPVLAHLRFCSSRLTHLRICESFWIFSSYLELVN
ncbi:hypothetical protein EXIGLDRAFT_451642 [Exidia glandulosa HHB12029]|uniref:Uncharacterized protein n=1 Tax=Exidia glandulosa HHB12029 TaxID=1314781 RepID=A0A165B375_EXIGL|nr:hypothetical protein EXIGLDRAFT_451642 [Exidia glandulosa HHB12029]